MSDSEASNTTNLAVMPENGLTLLDNMLAALKLSCNYFVALPRTVSAARKFCCVLSRVILFQVGMKTRIARTYPFSTGYHHCLVYHITEGSFASRNVVDGFGNLEIFIRNVEFFVRNMHL